MNKQDLINWVKEMPIEYATRENDKWATVGKDSMEYCPLGWAAHFLWPKEVSDGVDTLVYGERILTLLEGILPIWVITRLNQQYAEYLAGDMSFQEIKNLTAASIDESLKKGVLD